MPTSARWHFLPQMLSRRHSYLVLALFCGSMEGAADSEKWTDEVSQWRPGRASGSFISQLVSPFFCDKIDSPLSSFLCSVGSRGFRSNRRFIDFSSFFYGVFKDGVVLICLRPPSVTVAIPSHYRRMPARLEPIAVICGVIWLGQSRSRRERFDLIKREPTI